MTLSGPDGPVLRAQLPTGTEVTERECPSERSASRFDDGDVRVQVSGFDAEFLDEVTARGCDSPGERDADLLASSTVQATCGGVRAT